MSEMIEYKEGSRKDWGTIAKDKKLTTEQIQLGCMQRIADSLERIEKPYLDLINKVNFLNGRVTYFAKLYRDFKQLAVSRKSWMTRYKNKIDKQNRYITHLELLCAKHGIDVPSSHEEEE